MENGLGFLLFIVGVGVGYGIGWLQQYHNLKKQKQSVPPTPVMSDFMPTGEFQHRIREARSWGDIHSVVSGWRSGSLRYPDWDTVLKSYGPQPKNIRVIEQYALYQVALHHNKTEDLERMIPGVEETVKKIKRGDRIH